MITLCKDIIVLRIAKKHPQYEDQGDMSQGRPNTCRFFNNAENGAATTAANCSIRRLHRTVNGLYSTCSDFLARLGTYPF